MGGAEAPQIMQAMGHRQLSTTQRYLHFAQTAQAALAERAASVALAGMAASKSDGAAGGQGREAAEEAMNEAGVRKRFNPDVRAVRRELRKLLEAYPEAFPLVMSDLLQYGEGWQERLPPIAKGRDGSVKKVTDEVLLQLLHGYLSRPAGMTRNQFLDGVEWTSAVTTQSALGAGKR